MSDQAQEVLCDIEINSTKVQEIFILILQLLQEMYSERLKLVLILSLHLLELTETTPQTDTETSHQIQSTVPGKPLAGYQLVVRRDAVRRDADWSK